MKSIRLLPVVIAAALALLLFKGVGLLTSGGYVLTGTGVALAEAGTDQAPAATGADTTIVLPEEPTLVDDSPTLGDVAPTLGADDAGDHGAPAAAEQDTAAEHDASAGEDDTDAVPAEHGTEPSDAATGELADPAAEPAHGAPTVPDLDAAPPADPLAEGVPMVQGEDGLVVPLTTEDGSSLTENVILERLSARRAELDTREEELNLRLQLVEAAEAQLEERAAALAQIEARINAIADQQKSLQEGQFAAIINMYQTMKPTEAAVIFNDLDMQVLVRVAQGMNPRKMAPILAKMTSARAQQLTLALAAVEPAPAVTPTPTEDLAALPQIVGQ